MNKKEKKRRNIFDKYSKNLNKLKIAANLIITSKDNSAGEMLPNDVYMCPICLELFSPEVLENPNILALEHIPPESVGGKIRCITCKTCNSTSGAKLDHHLKYQINYLNVLSSAPDSEIDIQYRINNSPRIRGTLKTLDQQSWQISEDSKRNNPADLEKSHKLIPDPPATKIEISISIVPPDQRKAAISRLRAAYLWGFSDLGYSFMLNDYLELIRDQINHHENEIIPIHEINGVSVPDANLGVNAIMYPRDLRCYIVFMKLGGITFGVILPAPVYPGIEIYKNFKLGVEFKLSPVKLPGDVDILHYPMVALDIWQAIENKF